MEKPVAVHEAAVRSVQGLDLRAAKQIALLRYSVPAWNRWRAENPGIRPDLEGADLHGAYLQSANLTDANLRGADLTGAQMHCTGDPVCAG